MFQNQCSIIFIIFILVIFYLIFQNNNESFTNKFKIDICKLNTKKNFLDDNTPEKGGVDCLIDYIKKYGNKVGNNYELRYTNNNNNFKYYLDNDKKIINFYNENGLLLENKYCLFDKNNKGCILTSEINN